MSTSFRSSLSPFPVTKPIPLPTFTPSLRPTKRKPDGDESEEIVVGKKGKRQKSKRSKRHDDENLDLESGLNLAIGKLDVPLLADYVAQNIKRFSPDLSLFELEDLRIPEKAFLDASGWDEPRNLSNMSSFLDHFSSRSETNKTMSMASKARGAPHTLVITSAGLRAADITRALRTFQTKDAAVAKLFAKHIKLKDAQEYVKKTRMGIGVGTPSRVVDLLDADALSTSELERVIVDGSHIDQKKRGIFDMRETQQPLLHLLNRSELKDRYGTGAGHIQLIVY